MRKVTIQKRVEIAAAHRQLNDPSKCGYLHGHNWVFVVRVTGPINDLGYIVNFSDIRELIEQMDHTVILHTQDPLVNVLNTWGQRVTTLPVNPTCENLSVYIADMIEKAYPEIKVSVMVVENTGARAEGGYEDIGDLPVDPR